MRNSFQKPLSGLAGPGALFMMVKPSAVFVGSDCVEFVAASVVFVARAGAGGCAFALQMYSTVLIAVTLPVGPCLPLNPTSVFLIRI